VLGCTHYPLLADALREALPSVRLLSLSDETAKAAAGELEKRGLLRGAAAAPSQEYYVSGAPETFNAIAGKIVNTPCEAVKTDFT
jgi:glutamate racemase